MPHSFPDPDTRHPLILADGAAHEGTVFLSAVIDHPRVSVGAYSYASADTPPADWTTALAPYLFAHSTERLSIGRFCQIAHGAQFITATANHRYDGFSTFPFAVFEGDFDGARPSLPGGGADTLVGHDVWIGRDAKIMPGVSIGHGAIIGAGAVVTRNVPAYAIVAGNPARLIRMRFGPDVVNSLLRIGWWHWPIAHILEQEAAICGGDIAALQSAQPQ